MTKGGKAPARWGDCHDAGTLAVAARLACGLSKPSETLRVRRSDSVEATARASKGRGSETAVVRCIERGRRWVKPGVSAAPPRLAIV